MATSPATGRRRRLVLTRRQWLGMPLMLAASVLALAGVFGPSRSGATLRLTVVYAFLLVCFRVVGKRELSQMTPFEVVTLFLIPQLFRNAILRNDNSMLTAIVGATTLFSLVFLSSFLSYHFPPAATVLQAKPTVLVRDGTVIHDACDQERMTRQDLESAVHKAGLADLSEVAWAILEADGKIAIIPKC